SSAGSAAEPSPHQYASVGIEERALLGEPLHQTLSVPREEALVELGAEALLVVREERALHPLDDVLAALERMPVDLEAHRLLAEAEPEEERRVGLGREDGADPRAARETRGER